MLSIDYVSNSAHMLIKKFKTRDPYELCDALDIKIRYKDLGTQIKAYYIYIARIRNIVINYNVSEVVQRILVAHELGHDRLHTELAMQKGFHELELFNQTTTTEFEANVFAAELLIDDKELLKLFNDKDKSFFDIASELYIPAPLLDFKFRVLKHRGYKIKSPIIARGNFLKDVPNESYEDSSY
jgi:Zn-dependent peptidase ImmA (M78 family)